MTLNGRLQILQCMILPSSWFDPLPRASSSDILPQVSIFIAIQREECSLTEPELLRGIEKWAGSYLAATSQLRPMGNLQYAAQASDVDPKHVSQFVRDVIAYAPIVSAVNFFSNLIHAYHADQLSHIPQETALILPDGQMSWLAHAMSHLGAFNHFLAISQSKL